MPIILGRDKDSVNIGFLVSDEKSVSLFNLYGNCFYVFRNYRYFLPKK